MASRKTRWTRRKLLSLGIPTVVIPGLLIAMVLGWNPAQLRKIKNYSQIISVFPTGGVNHKAGSLIGRFFDISSVGVI
ncbi:hypothetical protein HY948_01270 [Candidatus Gottesmanbacteria bacterium]|nr:hypothetical protein [Candidatus Gottesmanbacteria bacterium]